MWLRGYRHGFSESILKSFLMFARKGKEKEGGRARMESERVREGEREGERKRKRWISVKEYQGREKRVKEMHTKRESEKERKREREGGRERGGELPQKYGVPLLASEAKK